MADAKAIARKLFEHYPEPKIALEFSNPLELLIATILSAQCTDQRVNAVTRTLFRTYRTAQDYAVADPAALEGAIRPTGFYRNKTKAILGACRRLVDEYGGEVPADMEALTTLPGVGRKTANVILGNAFGIPGIAVDTHVLRVSRRLGLTQTDDPIQAEKDLMAQVPKKDWTRFSLAVILHGRETCTARRPYCGRCVVYALCEFPEKERYAAKG